MNTTPPTPRRLPFLRHLITWSPCHLVIFLLLAGVGCDEPPETKPAEARKVEVGKNVYLEVQGTRRRVLIEAAVCLRMGQLEQLLCRKNTKEHESVLAADLDARHVHAALVAAGAKEGAPVKFQPKYLPASGQKIRVTLRYEDKDKKVVTVPAQQWLRNVKTRKDLDQDWVFAGSRFVTNPLDKTKEIYLANDGDVICVSNFETALLDLPFNSPKDNDDLIFEAHTERIPPMDTKVTVILEPIPEKK
jgi:hypothetical protein